MHTIGESAALGASGVILWGGYDYSASKVSSGFPTNTLEVFQILVFVLILHVRDKWLLIICSVDFNKTQRA